VWHAAWKIIHLLYFWTTLGWKNGTMAEETTVTLRQATVADWAVLVSLDQLIFGSYGAQEDPETIRARLAVFPAGCAVLEETHLKFTHAAHQQILGYLTTEKWATLREPALDEDPYQTHQPQGQILNITTLAIAPAHQQRKLGARLVEHALVIARQERCTAIILETAHAERFYQRHYFTKIGERQQRGILLHIMYYDLTQ
jgi:ribosomal protein S18 acetylase RimI-like enzyme